MIGTSRRNRPPVCQRRSNCHEQCDYSALSQRNEALELESLEEHRRVARGILPRHGGREVKTTGDGFLLEFPSALAAVQGAVEIQSALHECNQVSPPERQLRIRIDSCRRHRLAASQESGALLRLEFQRLLEQRFHFVIRVHHCFVCPFSTASICAHDGARQMSRLRSLFGSIFKPTILLPSGENARATISEPSVASVMSS